MPPKRKSATKATENLKEDDAKAEAGTKRKAEDVDDDGGEQGTDDEDAQNPADVASEDGGDRSAKEDNAGDSNAGDSDDAAAESAPKRRKTSTASPTTKLLTYLLSPAAMALAYPPQSPSPSSSPNAEKITYPHTSLTPFQSLLAALILSKPLSHRLGQRSINTLLNEPYNLTGPEQLEDAGFEGRREALDAARTQHRQKTAGELGGLVEAVRGAGLGGEGEDGEQGLTGLRGMLKGLGLDEAQEKVKEALVEKVKGMGPTGVGIFLRRVQGEWDEVYPFLDERSLAAARDLGVLEQGEGPDELVEKMGEVLGEEVEEDERRQRLVRLLDVLIGLALEKKIDEAKRAAEAGGT
jgi:hypothetical protein